MVWLYYAQNKKWTILSLKKEPIRVQWCYTCHKRANIKLAQCGNNLNFYNSVDLQENMQVTNSSLIWQAANKDWQSVNQHSLLTKLKY